MVIAFAGRRDHLRMFAGEVMQGWNKGGSGKTAKLVLSPARVEA